MSLSGTFNQTTEIAAPPLTQARKPRKRPSPFSIRLTEDERTRLVVEAAGAPLGAYIKAKVLGAPPLLVAVYGLFSVVMTFFAHANVNIPAGVDALVRMVFVTPDVHRTHHSIDMEEANSNFAAITPIWDRLFGTYRAAPALGHARMGIGVKDVPVGEAIGLLAVLRDPFQRRTSGGVSNQTTA